MWVMLDEGCNSTCHARTTKVLSKHGLKMEKLDHSGGQFRGVGAARVLGRWRMPFSVQLRPSELRVHGELESTELDNKEMLMLLSLQAQSQLGLVKDMRQGTASMSDYPGQSLRLSRHKGTGLILLCISDFSRKPVREHKRFLEDGRRSHLTYSIPEGDLVNRGPHVTGNQQRKVSLYLLGIEKFERGHKCLKNSTPFGELLRSLWSSHEWKVNREDHVKPFLQNLKENYAFMQCRTSRWSR